MLLTPSQQVTAPSLTSVQAYRRLETESIQLQAKIDALQIRHDKAVSDLASSEAVKVINAEDPTQLQSKLDALQALLDSIETQLETTSITALEQIAAKKQKERVANEVTLIAKLNSLGIQYAATYRQLRGIQGTSAAVTLTDSGSNVAKQTVFSRVSSTDYAVTRVPIV